MPISSVSRGGGSFRLGLRDKVIADSTTAARLSASAWWRSKAMTCSVRSAARERRRDQGGGKFLTFFLAGEEYGLEILKVQEIIGIKDITPMPRTPEHIRGVINLRGKVIPIVDLRLPELSTLHALRILGTDSRCGQTHVRTERNGSEAPGTTDPPKGCRPATGRAYLPDWGFAPSLKCSMGL